MEALLTFCMPLLVLERHRKLFSQLWRSCEAHASLFVRWHIESSFYHCRSPVKVVQASLGDKKDVEVIFTTVEVLLSLFTPVWVSRKIQRAVFTIGQFLLTCGMAFSVQGKT